MLEWKDRYATGVEKVDVQHRKLFKMINDFEELVRAGTAENRFADALRFLGSYTKTHFTCEEICMQKMKCPVLEVNKKAHADFLATFTRFTKRFDSEGYSTALANELLKTVNGWLVQHICAVDTQMKQCVATT